MLPNDEQEHQRLGALLRGAYSASEPTEQFVSGLHERLLGELANSQQPELLAADRPLETTRPWSQITHWIGGLTMRQRIALGGVGVAALLAFLLLWGGPSARPVAAMEKMAESIRGAKSFQATMSMEFTSNYERDKPPRTTRINGKIYWFAPHSYRSESQSDRGDDSVEIYPAGKPGICIDHKAKIFLRHPGVLQSMSPLLMLDKLSQFSGQADRKLGTKEIGGKMAWGFEIAREKVDPEEHEGTLEVWLDGESNLPVFVLEEIHLKDKSFARTTQFKDFHWNVEPDPRLFDTTPPEGYTDNTNEPMPLKEQIRQITEALTTYVEVMGGGYPEVRLGRVPGIAQKVAEKRGANWPPRSMEEYRAGGGKKANQLMIGLEEVAKLQAYNPDAAYYGKTVTPEDKDKVLLRWKLDDGRYEVIFGDLRAETVTAERLRALEGK